MKKGLLILMICLASVAAQARSVKLGYGDISNHSPTPVGTRPSGNVCGSSAMCPTGFRCASGKCVQCKKGDSDCNCPSGAEVVGTGVCGCASGKVARGSSCVEICDLTTCKAGYSKVSRGNQCCCE